MEAVTIAGLAVVAAGAYFSLVDLIADTGLACWLKRMKKKRSLVCGRDIITPQSRIKKVAGMHI